MTNDLTKTLTWMLTRARDESWSDNRCMLAASRLDARVENNEFTDEQQPGCVDCPGVPHRGHTNLTERQPESVSREELAAILADTYGMPGHPDHLHAADMLLPRYTITRKQETT